MPLKTAEITKEYKKNNGLKQEDVKILAEWATRQPHLPPMTELQIILFLQSCYYKIEMAKKTIDIFHTVRTHCEEIFSVRDPSLPAVKEFINLGVFQPLPKATQDNYKVIFCKIIDLDPSKFVYAEQIRVFDMSTMLWLMQEGTQQGIVIVLDMNGLTFTHFLKLGVMTIKKFLYYLQDAMPVRLKGLHFINVVSFIDKLVALMRPFMKQELLDVFHIHSESIDTLYKFVPKECMPTEFGGTAGTTLALQETMKRRLFENVEYFRAEEKQVVDESKRPGKPKNAGDIFGIEGTFKKLDID